MAKEVCKQLIKILRLSEKTSRRRRQYHIFILPLPTTWAIQESAPPKNIQQHMESKISAKFDHFNINVTDLERSIAFYREALGLEPCGEINGPDGAFKIVYLKNENSDFKLELTWLKEHPQPYDLGECEFHICLRVPGDYAATRATHKAMNCVCFENEEMGLYFISDPDGYWIEILPLEQN